MSNLSRLPTQTEQFGQQSEQYILVQSLGYLIKSQLMSLRSISNFRSLMSFLLSNATNYKEATITQLKQTTQDIHQELGQFFSYLLKLTNLFQQNQQLNTLHPTVNQLKQEIDALLQDCSTKFYVFSPLIYQFCDQQNQQNQSEINNLQNPDKVIDLLLQIYKSSATHALPQQNQQNQVANQNDDLIITLQQQVQFHQDQNNSLNTEIVQLKQQLSQMGTNNQLGASFQSTTGGGNATNYGGSGNLEKLNQLITENQLLKQNIQDLRSSLKNSVRNEQNTNQVMSLLKEQLAQKEQQISTLQQQTEQYQQKLNENMFQQQNQDLAHLQRFNDQLNNLSQLLKSNLSSEQQQKLLQYSCLQNVLNIAQIQQNLQYMTQIVNAGIQQLQSAAQSNAQLQVQLSNYHQIQEDNNQLILQNQKKEIEIQQLNNQQQQLNGKIALLNNQIQNQQLQINHHQEIRDNLSAAPQKTSAQNVQNVANQLLINQIMKTLQLKQDGQIVSKIQELVISSQEYEQLKQVQEVILEQQLQIESGLAGMFR